MKIRKAGLFDAELIKSLMLEALKSDPTAFTVEHDEFSRNGENWWKSYLNDYLVGIYSNLFFAVDENEKPIGMIGITYNKRKRLTHVATIVWFYLNNNYRGKGIGENLLDHALKVLEENDLITKINLTVISSQEKAINIYLKNQFLIVGTQKNEIKIGDNFYDFITMEKALT